MATLPPQCIYCGSKSDLTVDHVPPKCLFPKLRRKNLLTLPACRACNNSASKDEEFFLATLMFSEAGVTVAGQELWNERISRMFDKNHGLRRRVAKGMSMVEVRTPAGIYLGRRLAIDYDAPRCNRVIQKVVRGLYAREFAEPLPATATMSSIFLHTPSQFQTASRLGPSLKDGSVAWPGVFEYRYGRVKGKPGSSGWLLRFFESSHFLVITLRSAEQRNAA